MHTRKRPRSSAKNFRRLRSRKRLASSLDGLFKWNQYDTTRLDLGQAPLNFGGPSFFDHAPALAAKACEEVISKLGSLLRRQLQCFLFEASK